mmetsp:Transcript_10266/g.27255  ORF Transcript_10266/g.27255 Transcript_10266/m.27255 type:complete len:200 (-) Transcript_10266:319-918(-)
MSQPRSPDDGARSFTPSRASTSAELNWALDCLTAMSSMPISWCVYTSLASLPSSAAALSMRLSTKSPCPSSRNLRMARQCSPSEYWCISRDTRCLLVRSAALSTPAASSSRGSSGCAPPGPASASPAPASSRRSQGSARAPAHLASSCAESVDASAAPPGSQSCPGQHSRMKFTDFPVRRILRASSSVMKLGTISMSRE